MLPLGNIVGPEIVIGLVGRIGLDTRLVSDAIVSSLGDYAYDVKVIKVTSLVPNLSDLPQIIDFPLEVYFDSRIKACNKLRELSGRNDILACLAVMRIRELRSELPDHNEDAPLNRTAYVIDQIKRPEESALLRQIYRDLYVQVSCHAPREVRERRLANKIAATHPENPREESWRAEAAKFIARDDAEEDMLNGQRVGKAFPLADFIVDASDEARLKNELDRFLEIFFGRPTRSPTSDEYGMALAHNAAMRSIDMSRQVGAAIFAKSGEVLALGCNEVPKAGGGTYWEGDLDDARDASIGEDQNTRRKRLMVTDVIYRLAKAGLISNHYLDQRVDETERELIDNEGAPLKDCIVLDSLEFGRMLHAEMCSIAEAARLGMSLKGHRLYCTTFPCHNCAKHIVGVGLHDVVYLQPYPKSHVSELYPDSIAVDPASDCKNKVAFRQFIGVAPARFYLFEKDRAKDDVGRVRKWIKAKASPISRQVIPLQSDLEKFALSTLKVALKKIKP